MARPLTEPEAQEFLAGRHVAVVTVASDDGRPPHAAPVWYAYEPGGNVTFFTGTQGRRARKTRLIRRAGVLSVTVQHERFPYRYVTVEGTVERIDRPPSPDQMLAITGRYLPPEQAEGFVQAELADPGPGLVLFNVRPDRWLSFYFGDD